MGDLTEIIRSLGEGSNYQEQGTKFLELTNTSFNAEFLKHDKHFVDDKDTRDIYQITLTRGERVYSFNFGQSINASGKYIIYPGKERTHKKPFGFVGGDYDKNKNFAVPGAYDVLSCLQKYDVGSFEDFCSEFGYDEDSRTAEKVYKAVLNEWQNIQILYNDTEIQAMQEVV